MEQFPAMYTKTTTPTGDCEIACHYVRVNGALLFKMHSYFEGGVSRLRLKFLRNADINAKTIIMSL